MVVNDLLFYVKLCIAVRMVLDYCWITGEFKLHVSNLCEKTGRSVNNYVWQKPWNDGMFNFWNTHEFFSIQKMFAPLRLRQNKLNIGGTKLHLSIDVTAAPKNILILSIELIINRFAKILNWLSHCTQEILNVYSIIKKILVRDYNETWTHRKNFKQGEFEIKLK